MAPRWPPGSCLAPTPPPLRRPPPPRAHTVAPAAGGASRAPLKPDKIGRLLGDFPEFPRQKPAHASDLRPPDLGSTTATPPSCQELAVAEQEHGRAHPRPAPGLTVRRGRTPAGSGPP